MGQPVYAYYFYGDSFTLGVGASTQAQAWVDLSATGKNWEYKNYGVSGQTISAGGVGGNNFDLNTLKVKNRYNKGIICAWGINDCNTDIFPSGTPTTFTTAYTNFFSQCITNGWSYGEITVLSQYLIASWGNAKHPQYDAYASALETLCNSLGVRYVNCKSYMNSNGGDSLFVVGGGFDGHPNDTGNSVIKDYILPRL